MPAQDDSRGETPPKSEKTEANQDEATIRAEEELEDAETAREAMDEALKQGAVPFERVKKDQGP